MTQPQRQLHNDGPGPGGENPSYARPGPDATGDIRAAKSLAESAANARKNEAAGFIQSPQGSGVTGHEVGGGGAMWEWDAGLAINEVSGEA
jgi:hypothetical protein